MLDPSDMWAEVRVAEADTAVGEGTRYTTDDAIVARYVYHTYVFESGVTLANPNAAANDSDYWLNGLADRPIVEMRLSLSGLSPHTGYHYSVLSETVDPTDPAGAYTLTTLAEDVHFQTAPEAGTREPVRFVAMGALGPGDQQPSYFYDVFDLLHDTSRRYGAQLWLALGGIDSDTDGHPNAVDPFFFNLYNAFHDHDFTATPGVTSAVTTRAAPTTVSAFRSPPYHGLLGGMPVYPTPGNHDICSENNGSLSYWEQAYLESFVLPTATGPGVPDSYAAAAATFNANGAGFYYTFRYGDVIFISLGIPGHMCDLGNGEDWWTAWGERQLGDYEALLDALDTEIDQHNVWTIAYWHDHEWIDEGAFAEASLAHDVDLILAGRDRTFREPTPAAGTAVVVGTGGFGDDDAGGNCHRPGFLFVNVEGNVLEYWKLDTHPTDVTGVPEARDSYAPTVREYRKIRKEGRGVYRVFSDSDGAVPY
jgi:hypothetical protein